MEARQYNALLWEGLKTRMLSAIVLIALAFTFVSMGGVAFSSFVLLSAILMMKEWDLLTKQQMLLLRLTGYPYIILPCASLLWIRAFTLQGEGNFGVTLTLALIAIISATDSGAYFIGKRFGKRQLAPSISPNKTWEGVVGGIGAALIAGIAFSPYLHLVHSLFSAITISVVISLLSQLGDLFKSWIKRMAGVKDAGKILPGHGGLLDRLDGYLFTTPIFALIVYYNFAK